MADQSIEERLFQNWSKTWVDCSGSPPTHNPEDHFVQQAIDILTSRRSFAEGEADKLFGSMDYLSAFLAERRCSRINHILYHVMRFYNNHGE